MAAQITGVSCCAKVLSAGETPNRCANCKDKCSCGSGCQCSNIKVSQLSAESAGTRLCSKSNCQCSSQCPCKNVAVDTTMTQVSVQLCAGGKEQQQACTMPGNCCCNKGSVGKL